MQRVTHMRKGNQCMLALSLLSSGRAAEDLPGHLETGSRADQGPEQPSREGPTVQLPLQPSEAAARGQAADAFTDGDALMCGLMGSSHVELCACLYSDLWMSQRS